MTFNQLFIEFQNRYGNTHDIIFFELLFYVSNIKNKEEFISKRNNILDFNERKFWKFCKQYFEKEKPLAHITSKTIFCDLEFKIDRKVLSPREVTEQMTKDFIGAHKNDKGGFVLDLCCGSGCIGISIKKHVPTLNVTCIDKYWACIFNTHSNALAHKTPLTIDCKDAIDYLNKLGYVDFIISNPPYINLDHFKNTKMYKWENKNALIAPENGLYFYKKYFEWLNIHNFKEAWLEIGYDQIADIKQLSMQYKNLDLTLPQDRQYIIVKRKQ